ncbi:MAG: hypothetical protein MJZ53_06900 [Paludibacteraceae bacterium]|nr:hypothetical protein [Paludibacteraceae bacterium]
MKKIFMLALVAMAGVAFAVAQPRAIGANLGSGLGVSYQHGFGASNMLDVAVNIPVLTKGFGIGGNVTYDWIDPFNAPVPWNQKGEWHWCMGVGGAGGCYGLFSSDAKNRWYAGVAGHIGIAYDFWFPMELSLDYRPTIGVAANEDGGVGFGLDGLYNGITLGIRYLF